MKMEIKRNTGDCHGNAGLATACGSSGLRNFVGGVAGGVAEKGFLTPRGCGSEDSIF